MYKKDIETYPPANFLNMFKVNIKIRGVSKTSSNIKDGELCNKS